MPDAGADVPSWPTVAGNRGTAVSHPVSDHLRDPPQAGSAAVPRRSGVRPALRDILVVAFYYRRILVLAFLAPVLLGLAAALVSKPSYVADERLLVLLGSDYVYQPEVGQAASGITLDRNQIMQSELEILQSEFLREAVVRKIGIGKLYPDLDPSRPAVPSLLRLILGPAQGIATGGSGTAEAQAAERMGRNLSITAIPQTNVIQLSFRSDDRALSAEVLNTLVALYFDRRAEVFRPTFTDAGAPQDQQTEKRLQDAEAALTGFSDEHQIADFDQQMTRLLDQQAATTTTQLTTEQQINALKSEIIALRTQVARLPRSVELYAETERAPTAVASGDDLVRLESTYRTMSERYQPGAPQLAAIQEQLTRARSEAGGNQALSSKGDRQGQNPEWLAASTRLQTDEVDLQGAQGRAVQLRQSLAAINARIDDLNQAGARYRNLKRARDVLAETFSTYSHNREEARLASALDRGRLNNIRIVQPAVPPVQGTGQRAVLLASGIVAGGLLALALLAALNALRETMLSEADVERELQIPVLVAVARRMPGRGAAA